MIETAVKFESKADYEAAYPLLCSYPVTTRCIRALEFIETLLEIADEDRYVFRGQNCSFWPIIASLFRSDFVAKPAIDHLFTLAGVDRELGEYYEEYLGWEQDLVYEFANSCMNHGIPLPHIPYNETLKMDTEAVSAYFVARNFGIPNRLLDFTTSPVIAAWFAADREPDPSSIDEPIDIVVWAIQLEFLEQIGYEPASTSWANAQIPQMQRQKALLLVDNKGKENYMATGKFQPMEYTLEKLVRNHSDRGPYAPLVQRVTLPQDEILELQSELSNYELSQIHLFPTMENVANRTLRKYQRISALSASRSPAGPE